MLEETTDAGLLRRAAERKNDEWILVQIRGKDCVALEVCYHKDDVFCKEVIEKEIIGDKKIMYMKDILEKFVTIAKAIENVDASKYRAFKLKQRLMKSYPQLVFCVSKMRNVCEMIVCLENLGSSELVGEHMSNKSENKDKENCTILD